MSENKTPLNNLVLQKLQQSTKPNIFVVGNRPNKSTLEEAAKILTANEGVLKMEQNQQIFEMLMGMPEIIPKLNSYFSKNIQGTSVVLEEWVEQVGITDIIDGIFQKIQWCFVMMPVQIPKKIFDTMDDQDHIKVAGEGKGLDIAKRYNKPVYFVYADFRAKGDLRNIPPGGLVKGIYTFGFKESSQYG